MIIRKAQTAAPLDRPFPDENTVSEMYCNEAFTIDNEAVEDWTSSLQMLQTFAAIFSAVLITLIVDSKALLKQDTNEAIFDAIVFLMNDLANGTHRPYIPQKLEPSTQSILVNCFFFASLCLSIATALAAVLAMQWVTDYGAVTRRAGSTPEERVKRRHFRYQGGQDWKMDAIIGALPIALHLSVLLFFVGLIVWMWGVHHSVFAVVIVCGAVAALFYALTTILAIFYPSCPYRTPLASWIYIVLHLLIRVALPSSRLVPQQTHSDGDVEKKDTTNTRDYSKFQQFMQSLLSRFASPSLNSRDDTHIRSSDKQLMVGPLVWLSNQIPISPEIYRRLLVFVDGFSSTVDPEAHYSGVPWREIFRALGTIYRSFVETLGLNEEEFTEFSQRTYCLSQPGMKEVLDSVSGSSEGINVGISDFSVYLLRAWTKSTTLHTSDTLRKQRYSDEVALRNLINEISSTSEELLETWYGLLDEEVKTIERVLSVILPQLESISGEQRQQNLDIVLYLISTGRLPWQSTVPSQGEHVTYPSSALVRRLRAIDWVGNLYDHPQQEVILHYLSDFKKHNVANVLLRHTKFTDEEQTELKRIGLNGLSAWMRSEERMFNILTNFNQIINDEENQEVQRDRIRQTVVVICEDLVDSDITLDPKYLRDWREGELLELSNPILRLVACVTFGYEWQEEWSSDLLKAKESLGDDEWDSVSNVCFKYPFFFDGDLTFLWQLRLRLWIHFTSATVRYLYKVTHIYDALKHVEQEISLTRLGIDKPVDFLLALFHLNYPYDWNGCPQSFLTFIPDFVVGKPPSSNIRTESRQCDEYLVLICAELSSDPARLIRLLVELIRADINHEPRYRRPENLQNLLKHAEIHLSGRDLRPFSPSCRRLAQYIKASYQQFEGSWDGVLNSDYDKWDDPRPNYSEVDRGELKAVCERVVALLESVEPSEGQVIDILWPRHLLRPTGTKQKPFEEDTEQEVYSCELNKNEGTHNEKQDHAEPRPNGPSDGSALQEEILGAPEGPAE